MIVVICICLSDYITYVTSVSHFMCIKNEFNISDNFADVLNLNSRNYPIFTLQVSYSVLRNYTDRFFLSRSLIVCCRMYDISKRAFGSGTVRNRQIDCLCPTSVAL